MIYTSTLGELPYCVARLRVMVFCWLADFVANLNLSFPPSSSASVLLFDVLQCAVCQREFVSAEYLQSHIHRRHPEHISLARREAEEKKK